MPFPCPPQVQLGPNLVSWHLNIKSYATLGNDHLQALEKAPVAGSLVLRGRGPPNRQRRSSKNEENRGPAATYDQKADGSQFEGETITCHQFANTIVH